MEIDRNFALVNLNNILHNYKLVQSHTLAKEVLAVVKADAYGHGAKEVAKMLEKHGCHYFAVASLDEAIELREANVKGNILIFGKTTPKNIAYLHKYDLIQTVDSLEYAKILNTYGKNIRIHVNIDTGMSRFGIYLHETYDLDRVKSILIKINKLDNLNFEGLYTHFADADGKNSDFTNKQFKLFKALKNSLEKIELNSLIYHSSNSAASIAYPEYSMDMVRLGIAMYGYPPVNTDKQFLPAMSLFARVVALRDVSPNDSVSYGRTYSPKEKEKIATIAIGYADGYNRLLSNNDYIMYKGQKLEVIGRVCMDLIMVKTNNIDISIGSEVEVFGENKPLLKMCKALNTIPYELLCNVSKRVKRIYK